MALPANFNLGAIDEKRRYLSELGQFFAAVFLGVKCSRVHSSGVVFGMLSRISNQRPRQEVTTMKNGSAQETRYGKEVFVSGNARSDDFILEEELFMDHVGLAAAPWSVAPRRSCFWAYKPANLSPSAAT